MIRVLVFMCIGIPLAFAQQTFKGYVKHIENNEPVIGAVVLVPELRAGTSTNAKGFFELGNLPKGTYLIQITYIAHKTITTRISFLSDSSYIFLMENAAISTDEVVVSGTGNQTLIKESPISIMTMGQAQWMASGSLNLVDAVARMPGMSQVQTGPQLSKPIIRGLGFNRVITMHDGIRQEDNQWGEEHGIHIDEYSIDKYEIIKGAGSLMYGSDGLGGVMSILSPRPVEEGTIKAQVLTNYQSNAQLLGGSAMVSGNINGIVWNVRASSKSSGNYMNRVDNRVFGSNFREDLNLNGFVGIQKKWGYSRIYVSRWNQQINLITGIRDSRGAFLDAIPDGSGGELFVKPAQSTLNGRVINPYNSQDLTNTKVASNNLIILGRGSLMANVGYTVNERKEYTTAFSRFSTQPDLFFYLQTLFYDIRYNLPTLGGFETTIGTNGMRQQMQNRGGNVLYPDFQFVDNGVFIFSKKKWNRWIVSGGIRHDVRIMQIDKLYVDGNGIFSTINAPGSTEKFVGLNRSFNNVTGSLGVVFRVSEKLGLKANVARGFRAPSVAELASNGTHAGTFRYEIGNVNMRSEESLQADLGATYEGKWLYTDVALFNNNISNFIYSERLAGSNGDSIIDGTPAFRYVQGNAQLYGLEGVCTYNPQAAKWLSITQNYSMVLGRNVSAKNDSARNLPLMPAPRWITRIQANKDKLLPLIRNAYIYIESEYTEPQNRPMLAYNTETATAGYWLAHAGFGWDISDKSGQTRATLFVTVTNLFDEVYQSHQSRLKYLDRNLSTGRMGVFNMGRNVSVRLLIPLSFEVKKK